MHPKSFVFSKYSFSHLVSSTFSDRVGYRAEQLPNATNNRTCQLPFAGLCETEDFFLTMEMLFCRSDINTQTHVCDLRDRGGSKMISKQIFT